MLKVVGRVVADVTMVAIALFGSAGTLRWWRAWALLAVLFIVRAVGARVVFRVNPALMLERAKPPIQRGQALPDKLLVLAVLATGFVGLCPPLFRSASCCGGYASRSTCFGASYQATARIRSVCHIA